MIEITRVAGGLGWPYCLWIDGLRASWYPTYRKAVNAARLIDKAFVPLPESELPVEDLYANHI